MLLPYVFALALSAPPPGTLAPLTDAQLARTTCLGATTDGKADGTAICIGVDPAFCQRTVFRIGLGKARGKVTDAVVAKSGGDACQPAGWADAVRAVLAGTPALAPVRALVKAGAKGATKATWSLPDLALVVTAQGSGLTVRRSGKPAGSWKVPLAFPKDGAPADEITGVWYVASPKSLVVGWQSVSAGKPVATYKWTALPLR